jgi:hypothetical protein
MEDVNGRPLIQTDASAAGGANGGPAVNDRGEVVGVLTSASAGVDGGMVQGFNFIVPAAAVRDFVADTRAAVRDPGPFDRAWRAALSAFFASDYTAARRHLAEADRLVPGVPDVKRLTEETEDRIKHPPPRLFPWRGTAITLAAVGGAAVFLVWWDWRKRNRFRVRPEEVARWLETGKPAPVLLDVRDDETYARSPVRIAHARHLPPAKLRAEEAAGVVDPARPVVAYCT